MAKVKTSYSFVKILTGSDLSRRRLPLMSAISPTPGPVVWLTACGHGDEVCGIAIIQELFKEIRQYLLRGSIYAFPLMNPIGFETSSRNITVSHEDLNRSFPGEPSGSLGKRIASRIFNTIIDTKPNMVLDLHNDWMRSMPYVLIDHVSGKTSHPTYVQTRAMAQKTGLVAVSDSDELAG